MKNSHIQWTDHTFNPWIGCTKVSPGCAHCYAEALNKRWKKGDNWGKGAPRVRTSANYWKQPVHWDSMARLAKEFYMAGMADDEIRPTILPYVRPRVFSASLADWLDEEVAIEWLADFLKLIYATPNLDWLLLTKRPENWYSRLRDALAHIENIDPISGWDSVDPLSPVGDWLNEWLGGNEIPGNVWIGTTVEDQQRANERIPKLLAIPANIRFLSCEPLLGPVDLAPFHIGWHRCNLCEQARDPDEENPLGAEVYCLHCSASDPIPVDGHHLHWVICGAESGPNRRPMEIEWARSLLSQCRKAGVAPFMKQMEMEGVITGDFDKFPGSVQAREFPSVL